MNAIAISQPFGQKAPQCSEIFFNTNFFLSKNSGMVLLQYKNRKAQPSQENWLYIVCYCALVGNQYMECKDFLYGSCIIWYPSLNSSCAKNLSFKADVTLRFSLAEAVPELKLREYIIYYHSQYTGSKATLLVTLINTTKMKCMLLSTARVGPSYLGFGVSPVQQFSQADDSYKTTIIILC